MVAENTKILTAEQEAQLLAPIDEHVGAIQEKINALRLNGTDKVLDIQSSLENLKRDRIYTAEEKQKRAAELKKELEKAKEVEAKNKAEVAKLIAEAESYLKANYGAYYQAVCRQLQRRRTSWAQERYTEAVEQLNREHQETVAKLSDQQELKDEKYVHKNRLFDAKMSLLKEKQTIKDRRHAAFDHKYHLIDLLRMSKFTVGESMAQKAENYRYTFNRRDFFLRNGLYIAIIIIFIGLCIATPIIKGVPLLTVNNILNILSQASPRMFLALGVAGLILLAGTDLSIGRMVGMGMTAATIIMHNGPNTGSVFGKVFDFTGMPHARPRVLRAHRLHRAVHHLHHDRRLLHREVQDAPLHLDHGQHARHLRPCHLLDEGRLLRRHRQHHPRHDHPETGQVPDHHPLGGRGRHRRVVHLEQDHLRQEPVRGRRQPRGGLRFGHLACSRSLSAPSSWPACSTASAPGLSASA